jgi:ATP-dependent helicase/nuclease subunit A
VSVRETSADLQRTQRAQRDAADPQASAWVSANAGTGKTHVLTQRAMRLMLVGTVPERILCLTYTKAAAAEMSKRVFDTLAKWVTMADEDLQTALTQLSDRAPTAEETERARTLFTTAIETPGGLKVQTIHSFCERLLQRFPLEAGIAPGFTILDDATARQLQRDAIDAVLTDASADPAAPAGRALATAIRYASEESFDELLRAALNARRWLEEAWRIDLGEGEQIAALERLYRRTLGVREDITEADLVAELAGIAPEPTLERLRDALSAGTKTDQEGAVKITAALKATTSAGRADALQGYFCTGEGKPRARLMTKAIKDAAPDLEVGMDTAQQKFMTLLDERRGLAIVAATVALHRLAGAVLQNYTRAKARRAALDYSDLITKTVRLLHDKQSAAWVLFKLDRGIDHILVDEAQDTSREQWQVVEALAGEFFSDIGLRDEARTLFAVGDEKQSIYSFQGAEPKMFAEMGRLFADLSAQASQPFRRIPLDLSFRTVAPVLSAVDRVFSDHDRTPGLTADRSAIRHAVFRQGHGGLVELWPTERPNDDEDHDVWSPLEETPSRSPQIRLADRIADTIGGWLKDGERLVSQGRPVRAGDIIILVRKRKPFAAPMVAALKARGIAVAGADRLRLTEQIAVQDLVSLGEFLMLPEDDLALAEVLKSPLFGFDDDDLLTLAVGRKGTLWRSLLDHAADAPSYQTAANSLRRWRSRADFVPPFEFFATILDDEGARARFLARLGPEAADPLDEFLNLALGYDDQAPPSLTGFLAYLAEADREVKRDMEHGRDEVRVMTVHGAKGLEAPIVFLPDTCATGSGGGGALLEANGAELPEGVEGPPLLWSVKGTSGHEAVTGSKSERAARDAAERNRLLYVAMTRARDRLYIAGFEGKKARASDCWYDLIADAMGDTLEEIELPDGNRIRRFTLAQQAEPEKPKHAVTAEAVPIPLPDWALRPAPREPNLSIPLAPSRLEAYAPDEEGEPLPQQPSPSDGDEPAMPSPTVLAGESRFLRGNLTHALLQHLPSLPAATWETAAQGFVATHGRELAARVRSGIVKETLAILTAPEFAPLFSAQSRAEVPIVARLPNPSGKGAALKLIGQIDRLVECNDEVLIVDYKTNRPPPLKVEGVAKAYLFQLAAYRVALAEIYPGRAIKAALLWTEAPRIMQVPTELLDEYGARLWSLDLSVLDANGLHS